MSGIVINNRIFILCFLTKLPLKSHLPDSTIVWVKTKRKKHSRKSIINYNKFSVSFSKGFRVKKKMDSFQLNRTAIRTASNHLDLFLL